MATLSTRRGIFTALILPRCDRSLQSRTIRPSWDGAYVYARFPKSVVHYPPKLEISASPSHATRTMTKTLSSPRLRRGSYRAMRTLKITLWTQRTTGRLFLLSTARPKSCG
eukprot:4236754-Pleurochrysis_carterae.AAC.2